VSKVTEKIKTRSKPTPSENFNSHPLEKINYHTRYTKFVRGEIFILYLPSYEGKELGEM
jgi:hypothetical protein